MTTLSGLGLVSRPISLPCRRLLRMVSPAPSARMAAPLRDGTRAPDMSTFSTVTRSPLMTQIALPSAARPAARRRGRSPMPRSVRSFWRQTATSPS